MNSPLLNYRNRVLNPANPINWEHSLNRGLVGCWMVPPNPGFRGAQTFWDLTRGSRSPSNGTLTNGPTWQPGGRPGGYGSLLLASASSQYVLVGNTPAATMGDISFALSCWIRFTTKPANATILCKDSPSDGEYYLIYRGGGTDRIVLDLFASASFGGGATVRADAFGAPSTGVWYHVYAWHDADANEMGIAVNGIANTAARTTGVYAGSGSLRIGQNSFAQPWNGNVDDVRIWKRSSPGQYAAAVYRESQRGHPDTMQWISSRAAFSAGAAPPATPGVFNAAWWMVPNKNIGICRAV